MTSNQDRDRIAQNALVARAAAIALLSLAAALAPGCDGKTSGAEGEHSARSRETAHVSLRGAPPFNVTCTVGMLADVIRQVGGERLAVTALLGPGTDPHLYVATSGDRERLLSSQVVFFCGHHLEGKMGDVLRALEQRVPTLAVCEKIDPTYFRHPPEFEGAVDPHLWFDVRLWMRCTEIARDYLSELDPAGGKGYEANAAGYLAELAKLDEYVRARIAEIPERRRVLITAHDAFGYFGAAYGIEVLGIQGISTEAEAAVSRINALVQLIVERGVPAVFVESTISEKNVQALVEGCAARGHRLAIGGSLFSDAMGAADTPGGNYTGMVRHNVDTIVEALK
ncbi:MAG: zinc ABC transporter substrate-binding protein [Planctomycetes bacterium]|nr:zinc ABC transporter substrate-binding protein [Planctomycetota bacterium]